MSAQQPLAEQTSPPSPQRPLPPDSSAPTMPPSTPTLAPGTAHARPPSYSRPPPPPPPFDPAGPPPRYTAIVAKVYPYSLRPILILTSILGAIYSFVMAVNAINSRKASGTSSRLQTFNLIQAILYFIVGAVEVYGLGAAIAQSVKIARPLLILAPLGVLAMLVGQIITCVLHFVAKDDIIARCVSQNQGAFYTDGFGNQQVVTASQANDICTSSWQNGNWTVFAWLIVTFVLSLLFGSVAMSYYRQLVNPSLVRTRQGWFQRPVPHDGQAYQMQMQPGGYYPPPPPQQQGGQQSWMVPPYPGPPADGSKPFEKSDYQPSAEWAQAEPLGYAAPPGPPPPSGFGGGAGGGYRVEPGAPREEEEAWARARSEGVTAHLTGHAGTNRRNDGAV